MAFSHLLVPDLHFSQPHLFRWPVPKQIVNREAMSAVLEEVVNDLLSRHLDCAVPLSCKVCIRVKLVPFTMSFMRLWYAAVNPVLSADAHKVLH